MWFSIMVEQISAAHQVDRSLQRVMTMRHLLMNMVSCLFFFLFLSFGICIPVMLSCQNKNDYVFKFWNQEMEFITI